VILGMNWITEYKGVIDCAKRVITLTTPEKKCIRFKSTFKLKGGSLENVQVVKELQVVKEYPDVFPEELPGLPPDKDVKLLIDLMPRTSTVMHRDFTFTRLDRFRWYQSIVLSVD
jgi:hypothetical protein